MQVIKANTYEDMSVQAAADLLHLLQSLDRPLICTASGGSPTGLYSQLVQRIKNSNADISGWYYVGLDEWAGMNGKDEGSSRHQLDNQLFHPLNVGEQNLSFFDGKQADLNKECEKVDAFIQQRGGIDVAILGIGVNGHIGMNEPGTSPHLRSHIADIHPSTRQIGQKYFKQPQQLDKGVTLGLATLLEARHIFLLASGTSKAEIIHQMLQEEITEQLPATLLKQHPDLRIYLDKDAAQYVK
jgi:galactosamine-6-phosphate isomerase